MKYKLIISLFFILFSTISFAQNADNKPSEQVKSEMNILKNADLGLSDIQITRITYVLMGEESNMKRIEKTLEGNKTQLEKYQNEHRANKINNIKGAMSPQQAEKFDALKLESKF